MNNIENAIEAYNLLVEEEKAQFRQKIGVLALPSVQFGKTDGAYSLSEELESKAFFNALKQNLKPDFED